MNKEEIYDMLYSVMSTITSAFDDSLKDDTYKQALETVENLEEMSQQEFTNLVAERISALDDFEQKEAIRTTRKIK